MGHFLGVFAVIISLYVMGARGDHVSADCGDHSAQVHAVVAFAGMVGTGMSLEHACAAFQQIVSGKVPES